MRIIFLSPSGNPLDSYLQHIMKAKAVILVGGETTGTGFRPLSMEMPKSLFPIAGRPLISHIIDNLVDEVGEEDLTEILLLGFFKDTSKFERYTNEISNKHPGVNITYKKEPYSMGTGGGLFYFKDQIFDSDSCDQVFVIHGDVVCNYPFKRMKSFFEATKSNATILGIDPLLLMNNQQNKIHTQDQLMVKTYQKDKILRNYGTIISKKSTDEVVHYVEKPESKISTLQVGTNYNVLINGGIYLFNREFFKILENVKASKYINGKHFYDEESENHDDMISLELDILKNLPTQKNSRFMTFKSNSFWYQLKTPIFALLANNFLLEQELQTKTNNNLSPSSKNIIIPVKTQTQLNSHGFAIGPHVCIGKNVAIGNGVRIKNSIICDDVSIGDNSFISNAIISKGVRVGRWCRIEGTISINASNDHINKMSQEGYFRLINSIVVLCTNTVVSNQVFVYNSIVLPYKELKSDVKYEIVM